MPANDLLSTRRPVAFSYFLKTAGLQISTSGATISFMKKLLFVTLLSVLTAGMMLGNARAQQTPAATPTPAAKTPRSSATKAPPAKTDTSTAGKAPAAKSPSSTTLTTPKDKLSYAIGLNVGRSLQKDSIAVDPEILAQGVKDALSGDKTLMTDEEAKAAIVAIQADLRKKQEEMMKAAGEVNKKQGDAFLAANKTKEGVIALPSGLQYKVVTAGTGPKPAATDSVVCNYRGTLIDGTEFDSSYKRGQPATFPVGQVIPGWTEALQLMPVGSKWQLFIPPNLAYGERSPSPVIGVNSTLIFDIELLSIQGK
jgi:FKBP-type peptidyl-prolyl cis-trans isomerase FklB